MSPQAPLGPEAGRIIVIGSGPVGLAIVHRLRHGPRPVLLIEAGGPSRDPALEADTLRAARKTTAAHPEAHMFRRRMLGGASTVWGGRCLPFEPVDFAPLATRGGWPIRFEEMARYLPEALAFLEAGQDAFDEAAFAQPMRMNHLGHLDFDQIERFSCPTDVWKRHRADLAAAPGVTVLSGHPVRELLVSADGSRLRGVAVIDSRSGQRAEIEAGTVIVAAGGIETPRLLLASQSRDPRGIGNGSDMVGRCYMTHLIGDVGTLAFAPGTPDARLDYRQTRDGIYGRTILRLPAELRRDRALPSVLWRPGIPPVWDPAHGSAILSAMHVVKSLIAREYAQRLNAQGRDGASGPRSALRDSFGHIGNLLRQPLALTGFAGLWTRKRILARRKLPSVFLPSASRSYPMELNAEQFPDPASRIGLATQTDRFGMPIITLDWRPGEATVRGVRDSLQLFAEAVSASGLGRFVFDPDRVEISLSAQGGHHIGTTRMAADPAQGVVDADGRVFGIDNLFLAGSSIFPTSGSANPTLVAVALAFRLADHLRKRPFGG